MWWSLLMRMYKFSWLTLLFLGVALPRVSCRGLLNSFAKALAVMMFIIFCSYGLGMWYGASEVARGLRHGRMETTGGDVLTVFWAILNGAMVSGRYMYRCMRQGCGKAFVVFAHLLANK